MLHLPSNLQQALLASWNFVTGFYINPPMHLLLTIPQGILPLYRGWFTPLRRIGFNVSGREKGGVYWPMGRSGGPMGDGAGQEPVR